MEVGAVDSSSVYDAYSEGLRTQSEQAEKLARISWELKQESDQLAMIEEVLLDFYA